MMAARTDAQVDAAIAAANAATSRGFTPVSSPGTITLPSGEKAPAFSSTMQGPVSTGQPSLGTSSGYQPNRYVLRRVQNKDGTTTVYWSDGSVTSEGTATTNDPTKQSAYDALTLMLNQNGLTSLIEPLKQIFQSGITDADSLSLALSQTPEYKTRFSANQDRINAGYAALKPAEYVGLENAYRKLMTNYGLPASYYTKGTDGVQAGFNKLIAGDVSATELENRLIEAQQKVNQANPEVAQALKQFYPGITNGDILAYSLDPKNALTDIKRKVAAAEIGGSALAQGLATTQTSAEALAAQGVTKAQAQQGYGTIAGYLPTAQQLSDIYNYQGQGPYTQATAEKEVFGGAGAAEAAKLRKKLAELEQAKFGGQSGTAGTGALSRDRAITNYQLGLSGSGQF